MSCVMELYLLLVPIILGVRGQCPALCKCHSPHVANCASLALTNVPSDRFSIHVQKLDISDNVLMCLDKTTLRDMAVVSLVKFDASRNFINFIHEEAFLGQSKLQTVDLSSNNLSSIEPKTFERNPSLHRLSLSGNQRLMLPEGGSFLYSTSLRVLHLSDCNLSHIPTLTFQNIPNLQELYVSYNKIEILYPLHSVRHLNIFDVGHNYLIDLDPDIYTASPELAHLNLSYNKLSTLNETVLPQLAKSKASVDLNGNPWFCDCYMRNAIYSWCRNNSVDLGLVCSAPLKFKDKLWTVYEDAGCDDDNTDHVNDVELMANLSGISSHRSHEYYRDQKAANSFTTRIQESRMESNTNYSHISIALFAILFVLLTTAGVLLYHLTSRKSQHTSPVGSNAETNILISNNV